MSNFTESRLDENTIRLLLDQAKNEGIFPEDEENNNAFNEERQHSYYEEALSIVNDSSRKSLVDLNKNILFFEANIRDQSQSGGGGDNAERKDSEDEFIFLNSEKTMPSMFPSIIVEDRLSNNSNNEEGRISSMSIVSSTSTSITTSLPKTDSRFLPK